VGDPAEVSLNRAVEVTNPGHAGAHTALEIDRMTVVDVLRRVAELAEGLGGSVDAVTGAAIDPNRKSRLKFVRLPPPRSRTRVSTEE